MKKRKPVPRTGAATMPCPKCGGITRAIETRRLPGRPDVVRRRRCASCGHVIETHERRA